MNEMIVAISVDKIQTFLTEVIHSHVQEKQTEDATLKNIVNSSYQISKGLVDSLRKTFPELKESQILLECSGVRVFRLSLPEIELERRLNQLFQNYYKESQGQKLLRWSYFSENEMSEIEAIKKAKKQLKQTKNWNKIIEENQELLFSFCELGKKGEEKYSMEIENFPYFVKDINALRVKSDQEKDEKQTFRMAILKADLDGMGAMFETINSYDEYSTISQVLNEEISLNGLHKFAEKCTPSKGRAWLFPFYIAGDDIFFAIAVENLRYGVDVCRELIKNVNTKIEKKVAGKKLGMSVGVAITFNKQPIRYYMEMVESQLKVAKEGKVLENLKQFVSMKISIGNLLFYDINPSSKETEWLPKWKSFLNDVEFLSYIRGYENNISDPLGTPNFFYTLLKDITTETVQNDCVKYINHVLYHLRLRYLDNFGSKQSVLELELNKRLICQLYKKRGDKLVLEVDKRKEDFENYLRLMLLFSDVRFKISEGLHRGWSQQSTKKQKNEVRKYLLKQPMEYLYEKCLQEKSEDLTDIFIVKIKNGSKIGYQKLFIEQSMFFRLRKVESIPVEKAAAMIELKNPSTEERQKEIQKLNTERKKEGKFPNRLYFDKEKFYKIGTETNEWTTDFIDSLMLFYQYHEMVMKFKR